MITLIADSNIAHLNDYFNEQTLGASVNIIAMAGRDISAATLTQYQPDALLIRSVTQVTDKLLKNNNSVKFIGSATIGTDHVDQDYLANRGIGFANAAGCSKHSVAQYVLTAILTRHPEYWQRSIKLGIIGLGNIGSTLSEYADDLGWQVFGYDPFLPASLTNNTSLEQLLSQSEVISLHVPLTTAEHSDHPTHHLIDAKALEQMSDSAMLINTARGAVISEAALLADLPNSDREVVLDVFEHEPVVANVLLKHLTIATPHIAGYTLEGKLRGTQMIFDRFLIAFQKLGYLPDHLKEGEDELMSRLLPDNPFMWQALKRHPQRLAEFYDILKDDLRLRQAVDTKAAIVQGFTFDQLRKNYELRREWQVDQLS